MSTENKSMNYGLVILVAVVAAIISSLVTYKAVANNSIKFATVDINRVVGVSKDIAALKKERSEQIQQLQKMAAEANDKIQAEKDQAKKDELSKKFLGEINAKKEKFDKLYATALQSSDKKLNDIINAAAAKEDLTIVFNKDSLITGGTDITDAVMEQVR